MVLRKRRPRISRSSSRGFRPWRFLLFLFLFVFVGGGVGAYILFFEGSKPEVKLNATGDFLGKNGSLHYVVTDDNSGLRSVLLWGIQGERRKLLDSQSFPRLTYMSPVGPLEVKQNIQFDVLKQGFKDGPVTLSMEAVDFSLRNWLRGNTTILNKEFTIDTVPPRIQVLHSEKYIFPGGTGIAIYKVSDKGSEHGVSVNGIFNRGFPVGNGREDTFISYFGLSYDAEQIDELAIVATDTAGNQAMVPFTTTYKSAHYKDDTINIGDGFLSTKIPEFQQYYPQMQGSLLEKYLYANQKVRMENNQKISDLCQNPTASRLWNGPFDRMPGSSRAGYADHRTYLYNGKQIDSQTHLGMDIASTRKASVKAANSGKVVYADYMGIYGNMILIDHGQGVYSLYSHLSQMSVQPGQDVDKDTEIGQTGTTGMAGGDHLHFSMLIHGMFVTPKEWWDAHWVEVTIEEPLTDSKF